ncbi:hypothetical protein VNO78_20082 [Psophocarpus tetragonolobus]|uniref:Uncharacterized protein n=1 Tax=Psophocarpus tetragonolobus TaxID=3891 RepID=A0AAN9SA95_PSOTE
MALGVITSNIVQQKSSTNAQNLGLKLHLQQRSESKGCTKLGPEVQSDSDAKVSHFLKVGELKQQDARDGGAKMTYLGNRMN